MPRGLQSIGRHPRPDGQVPDEVYTHARHESSVRCQCTTVRGTSRGRRPAGHPTMPTGRRTYCTDATALRPLGQHQAGSALTAHPASHPDSLPGNEHMYEVGAGVVARLTHSGDVRPEHGREQVAIPTVGNARSVPCGLPRRVRPRTRPPGSGAPCAGRVPLAVRHR
jgi:hypothetical protein